MFVNMILSFLPQKGFFCECKVETYKSNSNTYFLKTYQTFHDFPLLHKCTGRKREREMLCAVMSGVLVGGAGVS